MVKTLAPPNLSRCPQDGAFPRRRRIPDPDPAEDGVVTIGSKSAWPRSALILSGNRTAARGAEVSQLSTTAPSNPNFQSRRSSPPRETMVEPHGQRIVIAACS